MKIIKNSLIPFKGFSETSMSIKDIIDNMLPYCKIPAINTKEWLEMKPLKNEVWVDITGYEGYYKVSCYGRILSLQRTIKRGSGSYVRKPQILRYKNTPQLYYKVNLYHPITGTATVFVHRIVAISFLGKHDGMVVNHKDENKKNPLLSNVEWISHRENCNYGSCIDRMRETFIKNGKSKAVALISESGSVLKTYPTIVAAAKDLNMSQTGIIRSCKYKRKYDGLIFRYLKDL
jgi:hypothetical protein